MTIAQTYFKETLSTVCKEIFKPREVREHKSCVNAISFSAGEGQLLVSGGDDLRLLLWNMYDDLSNTKPIKEYYGHENNIFCAIFDSSVRHVMSCGLDGIIFRYDIETGGSPLSEYQHDDSVFKIDLLCSSDEVLFSAGNDCRLRLWDFRASGVCPSQERKENFSISSLACHPTVDHLLLIGGLDGQLSLFDIRNGLGHKSVRDVF